MEVPSQGRQTVALQPQRAAESHPRRWIEWNGRRATEATGLVSHHHSIRPRPPPPGHWSWRPTRRLRNAAGAPLVCSTNSDGPLVRFPPPSELERPCRKRRAGAFPCQRRSSPTGQRQRRGGEWRLTCRRNPELRGMVAPR
eukprot:scaffold139316_cov31-Tisochrysis_lutea.AAC.3